VRSFHDRSYEHARTRATLPNIIMVVLVYYGPVVSDAFWRGVSDDGRR
jgi:hypothetical protein